MYCHLCTSIYTRVYVSIHICDHCIHFALSIFFESKKIHLFTQTKRSRITAKCSPYFSSVIVFATFQEFFFLSSVEIFASTSYPPIWKKKICTKRKKFARINFFVAGSRIVFWHDTIFKKKKLQAMGDKETRITFCFSSQLWPSEENELESSKMTWQSSSTMKLLSRVRDMMQELWPTVLQDGHCIHSANDSSRRVRSTQQIGHAHLVSSPPDRMCLLKR